MRQKSGPEKQPAEEAGRRSLDGCRPLETFPFRVSIGYGGSTPNCNVRRRDFNGRFTSILLKNSQIEQLRKSRSRAHSVVQADGRHGKPLGRVTGGEAGHSAEPLSNFPSRLPAVF